MRNIFYIISGFLFISSIHYAQLTVKDQESTPNILMQVNDEGDAGSITLQPLSSIGTNVNKLYNLGGSLYWNNSELGFSESSGWQKIVGKVTLQTNTDFVGIGNSDPQVNLDITSSAVTMASKIRLGNADNTHTLFLFSGNSTDLPYISFTDGDALRFAKYDGAVNELMRITSDGKVGIGASSPSTNLHINGSPIVARGQLSISSPLGEDVFISFYEGNNFKSYLWYDDSDDDLRLQNYNEENSGDLNLNPYGGNVGIGTNSPMTSLHVNGNDGVIFTGEYPSGIDLYLGSGTRMMWYPKRASFRSGILEGDGANFWNDNMIGEASFAVGKNTLAHGDYSFASGYFAKASGDHSVAIGTFCEVTGDYSFAFGKELHCQSSYSTAIGYYNEGFGSPNEMLPTDPVFEIGIGNGELNRKNALTVLKNGNIGIGISSPLSVLHAVGPNIAKLVTTNDGVYGESSTSGGSGVAGINTGSGNGVYGRSSSGYAGKFEGDVNITGVLSKGSGTFKIDHPLDPENKYLNHSFVESPDMMNIYNGNVITDKEGNVKVTLPEWFGALNKDFRYQLTVIGCFAQAIISKEVVDNMFSIRTDKPNVKVSWQVTGIRKDAFAEMNRVQVEEFKNDNERGKYLHPEAFNIPVTASIK